MIRSGFILDFYGFFIVEFPLAAVGPVWHLIRAFRRLGPVSLG